MYGMKAAAALAMVYLLQGCATSGLEARQLSWNGSGPNPCLLGGVTDAAQQHCSAMRWKDDGLLMALNREATASLPKNLEAKPCQIHVARLEQALQAHPDLTHDRLYSCPGKNNPQGGCHVSLLVRDAEGRSYVLDNGAVLADRHYRASVATLNEFADELGSVYWIGYIPKDAREIAMANFGKF